MSYGDPSVLALPDIAVHRLCVSEGSSGILGLRCAAFGACRWANHHGGKIRTALPLMMRSAAILFALL